MPAYRALDIDNFHDAACKVGLYKDAVTAFCHPYTLGAIAARIRKTGGSLSSNGRDTMFGGVTIVTAENWSKDEVTFCTDLAVGIGDALFRRVISDKAVSELKISTVAAHYTDVTDELECSPNPRYRTLRW